MSELQKKSEQIVKLKEIEEKWHMSDLIQSENERLRAENERLVQENKEILVNTEQEQEKISQRALDLDEREKNLDKKTDVMNKVFAYNYRSECDARLEERINDMQREIQKKTDKQINKVYIPSIIIGFYAAAMTLICGIGSETFKIEFKAFFVALWGFLRFSVDLAVKWADFISNLDIIPNFTVALIVDFIITWSVVISILNLILFLFYWGIKTFAKLYKEHFLDNISMAVFLLTLFLLMLFADKLVILPINLIVQLMIFHLIYMSIRYVLEH